MLQSTNQPELILIQGEQLSAVTFVQDYVQLQFDGPTITAITRPVVISGDDRFEFETPGYRDRLCALISKKVLRANVWPNDRLQIDFGEHDAIVVPLNPGAYRAAEAVIFRDGKTEQWLVW